MNKKLVYVFSLLGIIVLAGFSCPNDSTTVNTDVQAPTAGEVIVDSESDPIERFQPFLDEYNLNYSDNDAREAALENYGSFGDEFQARLDQGSPYDLFLCNQESWEHVSYSETEYEFEGESPGIFPTDTGTITVTFRQDSLDVEETAIYTFNRPFNVWQIIDVSCPRIES